MPVDTPSFGSDNAFAGVMNQAKSAAEEFTRVFSQMKMPLMPDADALLAFHRRNFEALSAANRIVMEGAQAVAKRNMEILQQTMADSSESMRALASPQPSAAKTDLPKRAYERAVSNMKELSDLIQHSNGEALSLINKRVMEAMDEVKTMADKAANKV